MIYTTLGTFINLVCTSLCAYPLSRPDLLGKKQVMGMIVFTMFFYGGMIPAYLVMNQTKLIDTIWAMALPGAISTYTFFYDTAPVAAITGKLAASLTIKTARTPALWPRWTSSWRTS